MYLLAGYDALRKLGTRLTGQHIRLDLYKQIHCYNPRS
jgi:hypothetical protein